MSEIESITRAKEAYQEALELPPTDETRAVADILALVMTPTCNDARSLDRQVAAVLWAHRIWQRGGRA